MILLDGKKYRLELLDEYKKKIEEEKLDIELDIILIGDDKASLTYVKNKIKYAGKVGIKTNMHYLNNRVKEEDLISLIKSLNDNPNVTGIILQSPVPKHIDFDYVTGFINSKKDIDGFTKESIYNMYIGKSKLVPCTAKGIIKLLKHYGIDLKGKNVVIVGRSKIVGKPLAMLMTNEDATVTLCHSKTLNLKEITNKADILVSAVGKPNLIKEDMVKENFIGIDVGISYVDDKLVGDFDFEHVKDKASYITPVPGGIGPMTIAMIMDNLIYAKENL